MQAAGGFERAGARGDELDFVSVELQVLVLAQPTRGAREHFERPGDVENLRLRVAEHRDAVRYTSGPRRVLMGASMAENDAWSSERPRARCAKIFRIRTPENSPCNAAHSSHEL